MGELEHLTADLRVRSLTQQLGGDLDMAAGAAGFLPTKMAGTVQLSTGNLPQLHWEDSAIAPPVPAPAGAQLGVPQPEGFDLLYSGSSSVAAAVGVGGGISSSSSSSTNRGGPVAALPTLPDLSNLWLPAATAETLSKHALMMPMGGLGGSSSNTAQSLRVAQQQPQAASRTTTLYPELAQLEPQPQQLDAAMAQLDLGGAVQQQASQQQQQQQQQASQPHPSPYDGAGLQLGPQEFGVVTAARPTQPPPSGAACCDPSTAIATVPPSSSQQQQPSSGGGGVSEVRRLQAVRDVHVSVALMDEFMRCAAANTRRGVETCGLLAGTLSPDDAVFTITTLILPKQKGTSDTVGGWVGWDSKGGEAGLGEVGKGGWCAEAYHTCTIM